MGELSRRELLVAAASACAAAALPGGAGCASRIAPADVPIFGDAAPGSEAFVDWAREFVAAHRVPGAQLAIARDGEVVCSLGLGFADRDARTPALPASLFRIASVSKPITATAVLKLVESGKLRLEDRVLDHLAAEPFLGRGARFDERWKQVQIVHCLAHTGGWDRDRSGDPMFDSIAISRALGVPLPVGPDDILRWQLGRPLDFEPGARYAYSNFGYSVLGRVIEHVTGRSYETYVREEIFAPLGLAGPRIGRSLAAERAPGEVAYYGSGRSLAVTGPGAGQVEVASSYGSWSQEALDSHGGWIASAEDLVRFGAALDRVDGGKRTRGGLLRAETVRKMFTAQATIAAAPEPRRARSYGLGWLLQLGDANHTGALDSTAAILFHGKDGRNVAFLTNRGSGRGGFLGFRVEQPIVELVWEDRAVVG